MVMSITLTKYQFLPDLKDIKNKELRKLAKRLKNKSKKETLTNIVDWQERNIRGWTDRVYLFLIFYAYIFAFFTYLSLVFNVSWIFVLILLFIAIINMTILVSVFIPLLTYFVFLFLLLIKISPESTTKVTPTLTLSAFILGGLTAMMIYLIMKYNHFRLTKDSKTSKILFDIFHITLPVEKILNYRLAICRDYAKLTASLLFNMYPDSELYFITILGHVATGMKIKNKTYVLDQRLPILSMDNWLIKWNKEANIYKLKIDEKSKRKPLDAVFDRHEQIPKKTNELTPKINTEKLTEETAKILGIKQSSHKNKSDFEISLSDYAIYYEDDEITKYSLIRAIKNRLENELCGNMNKISKINISQNKRDLTVSVCL